MGLNGGASDVVSGAVVAELAMLLPSLSSSTLSVLTSLVNSATVCSSSSSLCSATDAVVAA